MQNNINKGKILKKLKIIYKTNILTRCYSLYYTLIFQKYWHVIDFIYFSGIYTSMTMQIPAVISMMAA